MKRYLLVEFQSGGCDYTIGCGMREQEFNAESMEAAVAMVKAGAFGDDDNVPGYGLLATQEAARSGATLYELSGTPWDIDIEALRAEYRASRPAPTKPTEEDRERAEYERLRAKYETTP